MEELKVKTKIFTDENQFTIFCKETEFKLQNKNLWDCYLIFNKTQKVQYIGGHMEEDLPILDKIADNYLYYCENDMLLTIVDELLKERRKKA